uniref:Methyltransferase n=1 Tax=uncultured Thiotrichaceae bacterium TaxID=298394 RepID=A0A6S6UJE6_9GAMM|nr:MAG: Unknown protein [uncultured Thiotrichaceae bacterium]
MKGFLLKKLGLSQEQTLIDKAARLVACEMVEGDYLEFGVYRGKSFSEAYHALDQQFKSRINLKIGGQKEDKLQGKRRKLWAEMRFFAFDSFEGLPDLSVEDAQLESFSPGEYACSEDEFERNLLKYKVPPERVEIIPGWFEDSCTDVVKQEIKLKKAAIVWIDCDLYSSTQTVLAFITDLLQDGTIIIFDDWFCNKASPFQGEQRAFREWRESLGDKFFFQEYQRENWRRLSFVVSVNPDAT